jgi:hypothetical protein
VGPSDPQEADGGPLPLRFAVLALWAEAVGMAVLALIEAILAVVDGFGDPAVTAWVVGGPLVAAAALWQAGRLLVNRRLAGQGLGVALQLTAVPVAVPMIGGDSALWVRVLGVVLLVLAAVTTALLVAPASRATLNR